MKTTIKTPHRGRKTAPMNSITTLPPSPADERRGRMIRYSLAMLVRMVCIIVAFLVPGWWALVPAIGAIVLPYVAVVLANVGQEGERGQVEAPGGLQIYRPEPVFDPADYEPSPRDPFASADSAASDRRPRAGGTGETQPSPR